MNAVHHRTIGAAGSVIFLDLALWIAGQHQLIAPFTLVLAGVIPLAIGIAFLLTFDVELPALAGGIGAAAAIAYASLEADANLLVYALAIVPACAVAIASSSTRSPWTSTFLLASSGAVLGAWSVTWKLDLRHTLGSGACFVLAALAIAAFHRRRQHAWPATLISAGAILFVAAGAIFFDAGATAFFAATIATALLFGLLASRAALPIAVLLGVAAALVLYRRFEILIALACLFAVALALARYTSSAVLAWMARLPVVASSIAVAVLHPAIEPENTQLWCAFTVLVAGQLLVIARRDELDRSIAGAFAGLVACAGAFTELAIFAGFGLVLTLAAALIGLLVSAKSRYLGLAILGASAIKLFAIDWFNLNGGPRVAIFIAVGLAMLLFAVRVKTKIDGEHESPGRR